jgi:hypothetical protein
MKKLLLSVTDRYTNYNLREIIIEIAGTILVYGTIAALVILLCFFTNDQMIAHFSINN